jgi:hypothetical protein
MPGATIARMLNRWEVPSPTETDVVEWWIDGKTAPIFT